MRTLVIVVATVVHLLPRPFGVSPIGAMALYSGAFGNGRYAWAVPLIPLTLAALVFGFYQPLVMASVFAGFSLATLAGRRFLAGERTINRYGCAIGAGALIFFVVSNIGNWLAFYPLTVAGLTACFVNGLPFLFQAVLADAAFCFLLFGLHRLLAGYEKHPVVA